MTLFEYLGILISVVMGLGITHLLIGVSKTIHLRRTLRIYWVHSVWSVNLLFFAWMHSLTLIGAATSNRRYHAIFSILWLVTVLAFLGFTTLSRIAT